MIPAPIPDNEAARLQALHALRVLDTAPEERFDWLVRYAAHELQAPIALLSLVDSDRQWFKARHGLAASETPREVSFCAHALHGADLFVVEDALADERFADNPLVTGAPNVRFYAGAPVRTSLGLRLGTVCVIDKRPRRLTDAEGESLRSLADVVAWELIHLQVPGNSSCPKPQWA